MRDRRAALLALASLPPGIYREQELPLGAEAKKLVRHRISAGELSWSYEDRLEAALGAISAGADVLSVARALGWEEFERLVEGFLEAWGFSTARHVRLGRYEIDLVAKRGERILAIECKRWKRISAGEALRRTIGALQRKALMLSARLPEGLAVYPVVVALLSPGVAFVGRVPVVPITSIREFLGSLEAYLEGAASFEGRAGSLAGPPYDRPLGQIVSGGRLQHENQEHEGELGGRGGQEAHAGLHKTRGGGRGHQ